MTQKTLTIPEIGFIALTRVALGIGIGVLVSGGLRSDQRKVLGGALIGFGAITTIPILMRVLGTECDRENLVTLAA